MAASRPIRPPARAALIPTSAGEPAVSRALDDMAAAVGRIEARGQRNARTVDLVVGDNRIAHGLGRVPSGVNLTPTVADAAFAWAVTASTARTITITIVGVDQPGAAIEVY
jgi:hypothetical protein